MEHFGHYFFNYFSVPTSGFNGLNWMYARLCDIDLQLTEVCLLILIPLLSYSILNISKLHWYFLLLFQIYCLTYPVCFFSFSAIVFLISSIPFEFSVHFFHHIQCFPLCLLNKWNVFIIDLSTPPHYLYIQRSFHSERWKQIYSL